MQYKLNSKIENKFTYLAIKEIFGLLNKVIGKKNLKELEIIYPPEREMGDFVLPCFVLAKNFKKSPIEIAAELSKNIKLKNSGVICKIKNQGPYLNFFVKNNRTAELVLREIFLKKDKIGENKIGKDKKIMIEYLSPNTNKPLHLGHSRNAFLGWSVSKILQANGYKVIKACLINDRGIHICKSMLAYQKMGNKKTPKSEKIKSDHFVGDYYVLFDKLQNENPEIEKEAQELLRKWEKGDKKVLTLWKKMNSWAISGIKETCKEIGVSFDKFYFESDFYKKGKNIILKGLKQKKFTKEEGAVLADLKKYNLPNKFLLRSDGTALYITQDIYLSYLKYKDYEPNKIIHIIGSEQDLSQKQLFAILDILKFKVAKNMSHLSYGMINVEGGKLKSREGVKVDVDNLLAELKGEAEAEIKKRNKKLNKKEVERRAKIIVLGALKYYILLYGAKNTVNFNPKKSLSFTGNTGPYLQYTYARIIGIIQKSDVGFQISDFRFQISDVVDVDFSKLSDVADTNLIFELSKFSNVIKQAGENCDPSILAKYLYELAKIFHNFYHQSPVLQSDKETKKARLLLIFSVAQIIKKGLELLGIETMEEM
ncbi:MAG: arginine--tRNA ligase [Patescibacteria group bacterium]|nr:arginine--tRNA ligase [Patescibacteria group bacterium]